MEKIQKTIAAKKNVIKIQKPKYFSSSEEFFQVERKKPMCDGYAFTVAQTKLGLKREPQRLLCPEKLSDMMTIVRDLQQQRYLKYYIQLILL